MQLYSGLEVELRGWFDHVRVTKHAVGHAMGQAAMVYIGRVLNLDEAEISMASIFADKVDERKVIDWLESKAGTAAKQAVSEQYYSKFEQTDNAIAEVNSRLSNDAKKIAIVVKDMV
ncbi:hypothetical protein BDN71DRAFT_1514674 [Pleurotus eryngii]|uniref:Uncharacterized protein n=1 Tax=Pleurotus eryngii TaxID=5323 RepID=A0A9P6D0V0_PLEER|nr:hypothetical protein BDN71DRAFT_1514674 [Pleurotus eryngii]